MLKLASKRKLRILDFDIEQRPLSWITSDYVSREVTAIGAQFTDEDEGRCWLLGVDDPVDILEGFRAMYNEADIVTGHFIRVYDLPAINAGMVECKLPTLGSKLTHDTKLDLVRFTGISKAQGSLSDTLDLPSPKVFMGQVSWRSANRLTPEGIEATRGRVMGDVKQHIELRAELIRLGYLGRPRLWIPMSGGKGRNG